MVWQALDSLSSLWCPARPVCARSAAGPHGPTCTGHGGVPRSRTELQKRCEIAGNEVILWARAPLFLVSMFLHFPAFLLTFDPGSAHSPRHQISTA